MSKKTIISAVVVKTNSPELDELNAAVEAGRREAMKKQPKTIHVDDQPASVSAAALKPGREFGEIEPFDQVAGIVAAVRAVDPVAAAMIGGTGYLAGLIGSPFVAAAVATLFVGLAIAAIVRR